MKKYLHYGLLFAIVSTSNSFAMFSWLTGKSKEDKKEITVHEITNEMLLARKTTKAWLFDAPTEETLAQIKDTLKHIEPNARPIFKPTAKQLREAKPKLLKIFYQSPRPKTQTVFSYFAHWLANLVVIEERNSLAAYDRQEFFDALYDHQCLRDPKTICCKLLSDAQFAKLCSGFFGKPTKTELSLAKTALTYVPCLYAEKLHGDGSITNPIKWTGDSVTRDEYLVESSTRDNRVTPTMPEKKFKFVIAETDLQKAQQEWAAHSKKKGWSLFGKK